MAMVQNQWHHFGLGDFTTHFRTILVVGLGPVRWGLTDSGFDPWPRHMRPRT